MVASSIKSKTVATSLEKVNVRLLQLPRHSTIQTVTQRKFKIVATPFTD